MNFRIIRRVDISDRDVEKLSLIVSTCMWNYIIRKIDEIRFHFVCEENFVW